MSKNKCSIFDLIDNDEIDAYEELFKEENNNDKNNIDNIINNEASIWENFDILDSKIKMINNEGDYESLEFNLPDNFFGNIINSEIELSEDFTLEKLNSLIQLYSIAFQFYLENEPKKAKAYQIRMEYLLTDKEILLNLKKEKNTCNNNNKSKSSKQINNINKEFKIIKNNYKSQSEDINKLDLSDKVNEYINDISIKNMDKAKNIIDNDVKNQNLKWKEKLNKKKKNKKLIFKTYNPTEKRHNYKKHELNEDEVQDEENNNNINIKIKDDTEINYMKNKININNINEELDKDKDNKNKENNDKNKVIE